MKSPIEQLYETLIDWEEDLDRTYIKLMMLVDQDDYCKKTARNLKNQLKKLFDKCPFLIEDACVAAATWCSSEGKLEWGDWIERQHQAILKRITDDFAFIIFCNDNKTDFPLTKEMDTMLYEICNNTQVATQEMQLKLSSYKDYLKNE